MPLLSLNKFNLAHKLTNTRWLLFPNKVNTLFLNNIFHALITDSLLIKPNLQILLVKLRNGPRLISELELLPIIQSRTKLF